MLFRTCAVYIKLGLSSPTMTITDKTRKILWGRSGNRCAICRQKLVVDQTAADSESVVGDECHIISSAPNGPRYDHLFDLARVDDLDNLTLLCRVHHKMVDDQHETYTTQLLQGIKINHEKWVEARFSESASIHPVRIRRIKEEVPEKLQPMVTGADLMNLVAGCHGSYMDYSQDLNEDESELVGGFLQNMKDWVDASTDLEPLDRVRASKSLREEVETLREAGFLVFAAKERQMLEGGVGIPSDFFVLHISVVRCDDPNIVRPTEEPGEEA